jgi:hypothetical protein
MATPSYPLTGTSERLTSAVWTPLKSSPGPPPSERDLIRRLLALPPERRTHFLRKRVGIRMSCL